MSNILITGGIGYIGTNIVHEMLQRGMKPVIIDNFSNTNKKSLERIYQYSNDIKFYDFDIRDCVKLKTVITKEKITDIIHLAGYKSVNESFIKSYEYIDNNLGGAISIVNSIRNTDVNNIIFSSTAAVYSPDESPPFKESSYVRPINPYGSSKLLAEQYFKYAADYLSINVAVLRYFNPIGAGANCRLGEVFNSSADNIMPKILHAFKSNLDFQIFGSNLQTRDGTPIRDYIHITDLANAHINTLGYLTGIGKPCFEIFNIGSGSGTTVLELVNAVKNLGYKINIKFTNPRKGDPSISYASSSKARALLNWDPKYSISDMISSSFDYYLKFYHLDL